MSKNQKRSCQIPMELRINLWKNPKYDINHIYKYIPWFFRRIKYTFQRSVHGYCDLDIKMCDDYLAIVLNNILRAYAKVATHAPSEYLSYASEDILRPWREKLNSTADYFKAYIYEKHSRKSEKYLVDYRNYYADCKAACPNTSYHDILMIYPEIEILSKTWSSQLLRENKHINELVLDGFFRVARSIPLFGVITMKILAIFIAGLLCGCALSCFLTLNIWTTVICLIFALVYLNIAINS